MNRLFSKLSEKRESIILIAVLVFYCTLVYFFQLPCPIYYFTGVSCPGCGMTRALFSLLRLDFNAALYYHPLIFLCVFLFPALFIAHIKKIRLAKKILVAVLVVLFLTTYVYRLFVLKSPVLHFSPENGFFVRLFSKLFI